MGLKLCGAWTPDLRRADVSEINPDIESGARSRRRGVAAKPLDAEALRSLALHWTKGAGKQAGAA